MAARPGEVVAGALDHVQARGRPKGRRLQQPVAHPGLDAGGAGAPRAFEGVLEGLLGGGLLAAVRVRLAEQVPGLGGAGVVGELAEDAGELRGLGTPVCRPPARVGEAPQVDLQDPDLGVEPWVAGPGGGASGVGQYPLGALGVPAADQSRAELQQRLEPGRVTLAQQGDDAAEVRGGALVVLARGGAAAGRRQVLDRPGAQAARVVAGSEQLGGVAGGALVVIGEQLGDLAEPVRGPALEPRGHPFVQDGAPGLWDRLVDRVAKQQVAEAQHVLAASRPPGALDHELAPQALERPGRALARELDHRLRPELHPDHRGRLGAGPLGAREVIDPRRQDRLDRRRHLDRAGVAPRRPGSIGDLKASVVDEHVQHLLDEEGVAGRELDQPVTEPGRQRLADELTDDGAGVTV